MNEHYKKYKEEKKKKKYLEKKEKKLKKKATKMTVKNLLEKRKTQRLLKKEENRLLKRLIGKADTAVSLFVRNRDRNKGCISFGASGCKNKVQHCCHRIGRGYYSHRWDVNNLAGGCVQCNKYNKQEHGIIFTHRLTVIFGEERVAKQLQTKNKKKPSIDFLLEIIEKYG